MFWVSGTKKRVVIANKAQSVKKIIGLMELPVRMERIGPPELEAIAPAAEPIPNPIPLALRGNSSVTYKKNREK